MWRNVLSYADYEIDLDRVSHVVCDEASTNRAAFQTRIFLKLAVGKEQMDNTNIIDNNVHDSDEVF